MKSVLIPIQPYWVFLIIAKSMGWNVEKEKTVEIRKNFPKDKDWDRTAYIYCSKDKKSFNRIPKEYQPEMAKFLGKVVGKFSCERVDTIGKRGLKNTFDYCYLSLDMFGNDDVEVEITDIKKSCVSKNELNVYGEKANRLYAWHISSLVVYDTPKELCDFRTLCKGTYKDCRECGYFCSEGSENTGFLESCLFGGVISIERPPQSWCYVEEVA